MAPIIGWQELQDDVEMFSDVKHMTRLEAVRLEISVPSQKKLKEFVWACVGEDASVEIHSPSHATITFGTPQHGTRVYEARVREDA